MNKLLCSIVVLMLPSTTFGAVEIEFEDVSPVTLQALERNNERWFKLAIYDARRYRVVKFDPTPWLKSDIDRIVLRLFEDVEALEFGTELQERKFDDSQVVWEGEWFHGPRYDLSVATIREVMRKGMDKDARNMVDRMSDDAIRRSVVPRSTVILTAWDIDPEGRASQSIENRYNHSELWRVDEYGNAELSAPKDEHPTVVGPPPKTPEEVAHHRRLQSLDRHAFYSARGIVKVQRGNDAFEQYELSAFEHDPGYLLITELDLEKRVPVCFDQPCGFNTEQQAKVDAYAAFQELLPAYDDAQIKRGPAQWEN